MKTLLCLALAALLILSTVSASGDVINRKWTHGCTPMVLPSYPYYQPTVNEDNDGNMITVYPGTVIHVRADQLNVMSDARVHWPDEGFSFVRRVFYQYPTNDCVGFRGIKQWDLYALRPGIYTISVMDRSYLTGEEDHYPRMTVTVRVVPY